MLHYKKKTTACESSWAQPGAVTPAVVHLDHPNCIPSRCLFYRCVRRWGARTVHTPQLWRRVCALSEGFLPQHDLGPGWAAAAAQTKAQCKYYRLSAALEGTTRAGLITKNKAGCNCSKKRLSQIKMKLEDFRFLSPLDAVSLPWNVNQNFNHKKRTLVGYLIVKKKKRTVFLQFCYSIKKWPSKNSVSAPLLICSPLTLAFVVVHVWYFCVCRRILTCWGSDCLWTSRAVCWRTSLSSWSRLSAPSNRMWRPSSAGNESDPGSGPDVLTHACEVR